MLGEKPIESPLLSDEMPSARKGRNFLKTTMYALAGLAVAGAAGLMLFHQAGVPKDIAEEVQIVVPQSVNLNYVDDANDYFDKTS